MSHSTNTHYASDSYLGRHHDYEDPMFSDEGISDFFTRPRHDALLMCLIDVTNESWGGRRRRDFVPQFGDPDYSEPCLLTWELVPCEEARLIPMNTDPDLVSVWRVLKLE